MILLRLCRNIFLRLLVVLVIISSLIVPPAFCQETEDSQIFIAGFNAYQQKDYATAIENMNEVLQKYPDTPLRDMALFWLSRSYYKAGNQQEAAHYLSQFSKEYPDNPLKSTVEDELLALVTRYEKGEKLPVGTPPAKQPERLASKKAKAEKERIALAKAKEAKQAAAAAETARLAALKQAEENAAAEKKDQERAAAAKAETERVAAKAEEAKLAAAAAAKVEAERLAAKAEEAKLAAASAAVPAVVAPIAAVPKADAKVAAEKQEAERVAAVKAEQDQTALVAAARDKAEQQKVAAIKAEEARKLADQKEQEQLAAAKAEAATVAAAKKEQERQEAAKLEEAKQAAAAAATAEAARVAALKLAEEKAAAEKKEQERLAAVKAEQEKTAQETAARERAEQQRIAAIKSEAERKAAQQAEQERIAAVKAEETRVAAAKAEQERIAAAKVEEAQKTAAAAAEATRIAALKQAEAQAAAEKKEQERVAAVKAEQEKLAQEAAAREQAEQQKIAAIKLDEARKAAELADEQKAVLARAEQMKMAAIAKAEQETLDAARAEEALRAAAAAESARLGEQKSDSERLSLIKTEQERAVQAEAELTRMNALKAENERKTADERAQRQRLAAIRTEEAKVTASAAETARLAALKAEEESKASEGAAREAERSRLAALKADEARTAEQKAVEEQARAAKAAYREKAIGQYKTIIDKFPASTAAITAAAKLRELGVAVALPPAAEAPVPENAQILRLEVAQFAGFEFNLLTRPESFVVGSPIMVPFEVVNRGNGKDSFSLESAFPAEFKARFATASAPETAISQTAELVPGETFRGIISLIIPPGSIDGLRITHPVKAASRLMAEASQSREVNLVASAPLLRAVLRTEKTRPSPGDKLTYRLAILNVGSTAAKEVTLRLNFPPQLEPLDYVAAGFRQEMKSALILDGVQLNSGESREFSIAFQLKDDSLAGQELSTRAELINNQLKTATAFVSNMTYVEAQRSILVRAGSDRLVAIPGQTLVVPFVVTNAGNVTEKFKVTSVVTGSRDAVIYSDTNRDGIHQASEPVINEIGPLAPREEASIVVEIKTPKSSADNTHGSIQVAFVSEGDATRSAAGLTQFTYSRPVLKLAMTGGDGRLKPGDVASFDLLIANSGSNLARVVELQSAWPEQLELLASEPSTSVVNNGAIIWRFKELGAGEKRNIKVSFRVKPVTGVGTAIQVKNIMTYEDQLGNRY